jgi:SAM-dependent methyltransferase
MSWLSQWHGRRVHPRRVHLLAGVAARWLPAHASVLDVGCGDGLLAATLAELRPDLQITGAEIAPRPGCLVPVTGFDGARLPFPDGSFTAALLIDVLHHTTAPATLLREVARVTGDVVLLKDHLCDQWGAGATLRFMDEVANRRHGIALPFRYLRRAEWETLFAECGLEEARTDTLPELYPAPASWVFGRRLHFFTQLAHRAGSPHRLAPQP